MKPLLQQFCVRALLGLGMLCCSGLSASVYGQAQPAEAKKTPQRPHAICVMNSDGTDWKLFFMLPQMGAHGSPSLSQDGKWLVYDGWGALQGEQFSGANLMAVSLERDQLIFLGSGSMPNFGTDSTQVVSSIPTGDASGIGLITLATAERESIDPRGWGGQWSPDGKTISYYVGRTIKLYDVETKSTRDLVTVTDYPRLLWNSCWAPDCKRIYFTAQIDSPERQRAIVSVNVDDEPAVLTEHFRGKSLGERVTRHPTEPRLMFQMNSPETKLTQLYTLDLNQEGATPQPLKGQATTCRNTDGVWSADGKRIFCSSGWDPVKQE